MPPTPPVHSVVGDLSSVNADCLTIDRWYASPSEAWYGEGPYYYFDKPRLFGTGAAPNKYSVGGPGLFVSDPEFVQQYVLVTNQFGPEYGRSASFVVNQITGSAISPPFHGFDFVSRSDWQLGSDTITGRYLFNRGSTFSSDFGATTGYLFNVPALSQAVLQSWTHNLSGHMVNEARVSFNRLNVDFGGGTVTGSSKPVQDYGADLGGPIVRDKLWFWGSWGKQDIRINNPISTSVVPSSRIVNTWQAQDNWNYVLGKHQLEAGVNWTYQRSPTVFLPSINSSWPSLPGSGNIPQLDFREYDTFLYAGDDWKIGQNLTLNLGLTYSYYGQPAKPSGESAGVTPPFTPHIESGIVIGGQFYGQHVDLPTSPQRGSANGFGAPSAFLGPDKVNAWSFGFERELTKSSAIEARYVGNRAYDLFPSIQPGGASAGVEARRHSESHVQRWVPEIPLPMLAGGGWRLRRQCSALHPLIRWGLP